MLQGRVQGICGRDLRARVQELLELVGTAEAADRVVKGYSGGMRPAARHRARPPAAATFNPVDRGVEAARELVLPNTSWGSVGRYLLLLLLALSAVTSVCAPGCSAPTSARSIHHRST
jgi:hypothetical protein